MTITERCHPTLAALLGALLMLAGCATPGGDGLSMADMDVVAKNRDFALVRIGPGQDMGDLAEVFLGHRARSWELREANAPGRGAEGEVVAVPLRPANISSVYSDGYRTLPILCYHQFSAGAARHQLEISAATFEKQLSYLIDNDFELLSFADVGDILAGERPIPAKGVVITIDDGYRSVYDIAWPILRKYRAKATLFNYTDFIGAPAAMTWEQTREMADSGFIEVESHGKSHASLAPEPGEGSGPDYADRVRREIAGANAAFRAHLGARPRYLSYPYGNSSDLAARIARDEGILLAATVTRGDNTVYADPYLLHRTMIYNSHDMADFRKLLRVYRSRDLK